jgi:DNA-binding transcriptional LysR family regulator
MRVDMVQNVKRRWSTIGVRSARLNDVQQATAPAVSTVQLGYLVAVTEHRTWTAAAAALGVSPSALSQGIAELERRLGIELFAWEGRRRVALGHTADVVAYARRVLAESADLGRWLDSVRSGRQGELRVGMIDSAATHHFPGVLRRTRLERPDLDLRVTVAPSSELLRKLADGLLDVAVCVDPAGQGSFDTVPLLRDELAVYAPPGTGARERGNPKEWGPWLLFPEGSLSRVAIERALRRVGARIEVHMESHQPEVLRELVRIGLGWSVLPVFDAESGPEPLERARPEPLVVRRLVAATRRHAPPNAAAAALVSELHRAAPQPSPTSAERA